MPRLSAFIPGAKALTLPVAASLLVHGALLVALATVVLSPDRPQLVDSPGSGVATTLTIPPAPPKDALRPAPEAPPPSAPAPTPPTPAPAAEPEVVTTIPAAAPAVPVQPTHAPITAPTQPAPASAPPAPSTPAAQQPPTPVSFAGVEGARAERVVYVLDASGAMTTSLPLVKAELLNSVLRLEASQRFQVVVFRTPAGEPTSNIDVFSGREGRSFCRADPQNKSLLAAWLENVQPSGMSDPLPGLREALELGPDLVFLLTRSIRRTGGEWGRGVPQTLAELDQLNPRNLLGRRPVVIKAVQFLDEDPTGLLPLIAAEHGDGAGSYRVLTVDQLRAQ